MGLELDYCTLSLLFSLTEETLPLYFPCLNMFKRYHVLLIWNLFDLPNFELSYIMQGRQILLISSESHLLDFGK